MLLHLERPDAGGGGGWPAGLHGGPALPDWLHRPLICDCDIETVEPDAPRNAKARPGGRAFVAFSAWQ